MESNKILTTLIYLLVLVFTFPAQLVSQCSGGGPCQLCNIATTVQNVTGGESLESISFLAESIMPGEMGHAPSLSLEMVLGDTIEFDVQVKYDWQQGINVSWLHGFSFANLREWILIEAFSSPADSSWIFKNEINGKCSGNTYGPGFYWDPVGESCPPEGNRSNWNGTSCTNAIFCEENDGFLIDGDPSDNWGINCTTDCPSFHFRLAYIADNRGTDTLELRFLLIEDGETGGWANSNNCIFEITIPVHITVHDPDFPRGAVFCQTEPTAIVEVVNANTGRVWMDRNLGAERAAFISRDQKAYGDLYQWGRFSDGHQCRNSETTDELAESYQVGNPYFIMNSDSNRDWRIHSTTELWQRTGTINNPCPDGFRPPTIAEWHEEAESWLGRGAQAAARSALALPASGIRTFNGDIVQTGRWGQYWSSTQSGVKAASFAFTGNINLQRNAYRVQGFSLRCILDDGPHPSVLLVKRASPASFSAIGQIITFTFEVTNDGETPLLNLIIEDPDFGWTFGPVDLAPGQSTTFFRAYRTEIQDLLNGEIRNRASVSGISDEGDLVFAEDEVVVLFQTNSNFGTPVLKDKQNEAELILFPNPTAGLVNIKIMGIPEEIPFQFRVFNTLGREVLSLITTEKIFTLNLQSEPSGIYFIQMLGAEGDVLGSQRIYKSEPNH